MFSKSNGTFASFETPLEMRAPEVERAAKRIMFTNFQYWSAAMNWFQFIATSRVVAPSCPMGDAPINKFNTKPKTSLNQNNNKNKKKGLHLALARRFTLSQNGYGAFICFRPARKLRVDQRKTRQKTPAPKNTIRGDKKSHEQTRDTRAKPHKQKRKKKTAPTNARKKKKRRRTQHRTKKEKKTTRLNTSRTKKRTHVFSHKQPPSPPNPRPILKQ